MGVGDGGKPVAVFAQDVSVVFDGPVDDGSVSGERYLAWACRCWSGLWLWGWLRLWGWPGFRGGLFDDYAVVVDVDAAFAVAK